MSLLVIGGGGREHALAWKLSQSPRSSRIYVAPGNAGTELDPNLTNVNPGDIAALVDFAQREKVYLTVVGPEAPLAAGVVDAFRTAGLKIFGPTQAAAQLESSKDYAKAFMKRHDIPTAEYATFTDAAQAHAYLDQQGAPIVIKADGLAAGKGVVVAQDLATAHQAVDDMLAGNRLGAAGARVVIEEFLAGEEASFICMVDGTHVLPLATSQDHKRLLDHDQGPNTGGMGAYSPAPVITPDIHARIMREIILPTVAGMAAEGVPYTGFLYAGVMLDKEGNPRVLEYNCRMGDPETQPILMRLKSDLLDLLEYGVEGRLNEIDAAWDRRTALGVVLAAPGYPEAPRTGQEITGLPADSDDVKVFHAGTALKDGRLVTSGGRVLCVTALGDTAKMAQKRAYETAEAIHFEGRQMRHDIGYRAVQPRRG